VARTRSVHSIRSELVKKSREAALNAIQIYNNPLVQFKSENYIVLMIIAWTYLLHAHYRSIGVDYRYYSQLPNGRRRFVRTKHGDIKHWDLERCLKEPSCPVDSDTANNLRFLIQLRHKIEHQMAIGLDNYLSARYQACALNYCHYIKKLHGEKQSIEPSLAYSLQFAENSRQQAEGMRVEDEMPKNLRAFITEFDRQLSEEQFNSPRFSYRILFTRKTANRLGQADSVVEFVPLDSDLASEMQGRSIVVKEMEKRKYRMTDIVTILRSEGFPRFNSHHHTVLWKECDGKNPGKGYGVSVAGTWYWYESWLTYVRIHCDASEHKYR
jgi:hypothetical protein